MDLILKIVNFVLHIDTYLNDILTRYGAWTYGLLFFVIFAETGLVVFPFLPGDSILFIAGTIVATAGLSVHLLVVLLIVAAVLGEVMDHPDGPLLASCYRAEAFLATWCEQLPFGRPIA